MLIVSGSCEFRMTQKQPFAQLQNGMGHFSWLISSMGLRVSKMGNKSAAVISQTKEASLTVAG